MELGGVPVAMLWHERLLMGHFENYEHVLVTYDWDFEYGVALPQIPRPSSVSSRSSDCLLSWMRCVGCGGRTGGTLKPFFEKRRS